MNTFRTIDNKFWNWVFKYAIRFSKLLMYISDLTLLNCALLINYFECVGKFLIVYRRRMISLSCWAFSLKIRFCLFLLCVDENFLTKFLLWNLNKKINKNIFLYFLLCGNVFKTYIFTKSIKSKWYSSSYFVKNIQYLNIQLHLFLSNNFKYVLSAKYFSHPFKNNSCMKVFTMS